MTDVLLTLLSLAVCSTLPFAAFGLGAVTRDRAVGPALLANAATVAPVLGFTLAVVTPLGLWLVTGGETYVRIVTQGLGALLVAAGVLGKERRYRRFRTRMRQLVDDLARPWVQEQITVGLSALNAEAQTPRLSLSVHGRDESIESRLVRLERNLELSREDTRRLRTELEGARNQLARDIADLRSHSDRDVARIREELVDSQVGSLHWEVLGFCWTLLALFFEARGS